MRPARSAWTASRGVQSGELSMALWENLASIAPEARPRIKGSVLFVVDDDGQHPNGYLAQGLGAVGNVTAETQRIPRSQRIAVAAVTLGQRAGEDVNEFGAGVLKAGKHFALVGQGHQKRLE